SLASTALNSTGARRGPSLCGNVSSQAAPDARPLDGTSGDSRRWRKYNAKIVAALRQRTSRKTGGCGGFIGSGDAKPSGSDSESLQEVVLKQIKAISV